MSRMTKSMAALLVGTLLPVAAVAGLGTSTTVTTSTTTTSTMPPECVDAQTFDSTRCRLDDLGARVAASADELGSFGARLAKNLDRAAAVQRRAENACDAAKQRKAKRQVRRLIRILVRSGRALVSGRARRRLDAELRRSLLADVRDLVRDLKRLRRDLACPPASPSGAFV